MKYDVTIGIPVYQAEKYLSRSLESALAQSYPSIEFLIVDDGSTDGSLSIAQDYQKQHPRGVDIRIISHDHNLGVSAARNRIIEEAIAALHEQGGVQALENVAEAFRKRISDGADAAAEFARDGDAGADCADRLGIGHRAGFRAVEVDQMDQRSAGLFPHGRLIGGRTFVDRFFRVIALKETDAVPVKQVDSGE